MYLRNTGKLARRITYHLTIIRMNLCMANKEFATHRMLASYFDYYHRWCTPQSLMMDSPDSRPVQPPSRGRVVQFPEVGGLHHHYERRAA
jgi:putative transposase